MIMFIKYFIFPMLMAIGVWGAVDIEGIAQNADISHIEALRLAKSEEMRKYMNESIDPCEDFYQFTCGNWPAYHPATTNRKHSHGSYIAVDDFDAILVSFLNQTDAEYTAAEWKAKNFYDSCLNSSSTKLPEYRHQLKKLIKEFGRMPAVEATKWQRKNFDWIKTIGEISYKYGIGIIFGYSIDTAGDPTSYAISIKNHWQIHSIDVSAENIKKCRVEVQNNLIHLLGIKTKVAKETAKEITDFAHKLRDAYISRRFTRVTTFAKLYENYSHRLDVKMLIKELFGFLPSGKVLADDPIYIETVATIMQKTPKRVVANYIFYALIYKFHSQNFTPNQILTKDMCLNITKKHFLPIVNNMVYRRIELKEKEQVFQHMWQGITNALQNTLESNLLTWFDDKTREAALEKLHYMKLYIASFDNVNLEQMYTNLTLNNHDFMQNIKSIASFKALQSRPMYNERRNDALEKIGDFTPSYMTTANVVRFPLTSLVSDYMWSKYAPYATNYGRLGSITAHEIMHGFSGFGRYFNKIGFLNDMFSEDIKGSYEERRQCYYNQYQSFTFAGKSLPQDRNQAENVADNGGVYLAYHAYLRWLADEVRTQTELDMETLPHLNYTNKQLYFIAYSQTSCSDFYEDSMLEIISKDTHSPAELRVDVLYPILANLQRSSTAPLEVP